MAVLDASPIIYYSRIGELCWLLGFYRSLKTTGSIVRETVDDARELNKPGVSAIEMALSKGWISVSDLSDDEKDFARNIAKSEGIEPEDAEIIVLAMKENDIVVTNDRMPETRCSRPWGEGSLGYYANSYSTQREQDHCCSGEINDKSPCRRRTAC
jgi:predicted nucleic acid-binding protein